MGSKAGGRQDEVSHAGGSRSYWTKWALFSGAVLVTLTTVQVGAGRAQNGGRARKGHRHGRRLTEEIPATEILSREIRQLAPQKASFPTKRLRLETEPFVQGWTAR